MAKRAKSGPTRGGRDSGRFALYPLSVLCFCEERSSHRPVNFQWVSDFSLSWILGCEDDTVGNGGLRMPLTGRCVRNSQCLVNE